MIAWIVALAAAAPPDGVDLDDLDGWEARSRDVIDGPDGCWELSGTVETHFAAYTPPTLWSRAKRHDFRSSGAFEGRFEDGEWRSFVYGLEPVDGTEKQGADIDVPLFPLMGKIDQQVVKRRTSDGEQEKGSNIEVSAAGDDAMNLLDDMLEEIDPATTIAYAEWSEPESGVVLYQDMPLSDGRNADVITVATFFPGGGAQGTRLDATFPRRIKLGDGLVKATVFDAQLHLRGQADDSGVLPALESVSLGLGVLGFTVGYEQKLTYTKAVTCAAPG